MDLVGNYTRSIFPQSRIATVDVCDLGRKKHSIQALIEVDVTEARRKINYIRKEGKIISFTAYLIYCISQVCREHKQIHGVKKGKRGLVTFDDVDVSILVEREFHGEKIPLPYVIRKANEKSITEICSEIRKVQQQPIENEGDFVLGGGVSAVMMKAYYSMPGFIRRFFLSRIIKNPKLIKKNMGTVVVTSLGMAGRFSGWFIPISIHPLTIAVGSVVRKPGVVDNAVEIREYLYLTVLVDHDAIDGAPSVRALSKLIRLIEKGYGL